MHPTPRTGPPTNRLASCSSPYLLQHASNPVDWYPWGEEAFAEARRSNRLIFLSVGYSTCHWCHVMERESFENEETARLLNRHFVNIKVDREERPDVDRMHMLFVQATTGSGGWPMSVWLTPELDPVVGGTYFPPRGAYGRPGFPEVIERIAGAWAEDPEGLRGRARELLDTLAGHAAPVAAPDGFARVASGDLARRCYAQLRRSFDAELGGFGDAPKFPRPAALRFLLRYAALPSTPAADAAEAIRMADFTLHRMAHGGMNDQLGGGYHRYSVDRFWHVPHFEKMLYDQAQLVSAHIEAFQATRDPFHADAARRTIAYVLGELRDPAGGFHAAEDADSFPADGSPEKREGAWYVWTLEELRAVLGASDAEFFGAVFGCEPGGNSPEGSDPHGEFDGRNILIRCLDNAEAAQRFGMGEREVADRIELARGRLLAERAKRPRPHRDDKILAAWNGLMVSALAQAGMVLDDPGYVDAAVETLGMIRERFWSAETGVLLRSWRGGVPGGPGFAEDYACVAAAAIDIYEATGASEWLEWASRLQAALDDRFAASAGGYYGAPGHDPSIKLRLIEDHDGAEPAASSVAASNLVRLGRLREDFAGETRAEAVIGAFAPAMERVPVAMPAMLAAWCERTASPVRMVLRGSTPERRAFARVVHARWMPGRTLLHVSGPDDPICSVSPFLANLAAEEGVAGPCAYLCEGFTCRLPAQSPETLREQLDALGAMPFGNSHGTNGPTDSAAGRSGATQGRLVDPSGT
jgi:uncharacterized protein YyaL (SSP411 family)